MPKWKLCYVITVTIQPTAHNYVYHIMERSFSLKRVGNYRSSNILKSKIISSTMQTHFWSSIMQKKKTISNMNTVILTFWLRSPMRRIFFFASMWTMCFLLLGYVLQAKEKNHLIKHSSFSSTILGQ